MGREQRVHELRHRFGVDLRARVGRIDAVGGKGCERDLAADDLFGSVLRQVQTGNAIVVGDLLTNPDVLRCLASLIGLEHFGSQGVYEDPAVRGPVERDLADHSLERGFHLLDVGVPVVGGEVQDREVAAGDHLAKHGLAAAGAKQAEPASAGLNVPPFRHGGVGKVLLKALDHLGRITQVGVLEPRAGQHRVTDEEQVLVAHGVGAEETLAVGNAAPDLVEVCGEGRVRHRHAEKGARTRLQPGLSCHESSAFVLTLMSPTENPSTGVTCAAPGQYAGPHHALDV